MFGYGKCPKCDQPISHCDVGKIVVGDQFAGPFFHGVTMCCPRCKTVLGVSVDPSSLVADIVAQVTRKIQAKTR